MEEEDLKGLQVLASNKQQKSYTRMVSQEFSCAESHAPVQGGRRRRRSKKSSSSITTETDEVPSAASSPDHISVDPLTHVLGNEKDDSEESEYFSAEEEHDECFLGETFSADSCDDSDESEQCAPVDPEKYKSTFIADTSSVRSKAPSKKQKKKRKELAKLDGPLLPFGNAEFMGIDLSHLKEEITLTASRSVFAGVPTLVELCILASNKLPRDNRTRTAIPFGIKPIFKLRNRRLGLQNIQLSWLLKMLSFIESGITRDEKYYQWKKMPFFYRNIWCSDLCSKDLMTNHYRTHYYESTKATCYIPHTFVWTTEMGHTAFSSAPLFTHTFRLSALANAIDLMLPPTVPHKSINMKRLSSSQSEEDILSADTDRMLLRIKSELEKKFPLTIKRFYHRVLPYVFWARGQLPKAARLFSDLATKEVKFKMRAQCLYEVGRMYSHFDEAETAIAFYKGAEDAVLAKPKNGTEKMTREVEQQTRTLCADVYDQGPMTLHKAQQAVLAWSIATHPPGAELLVSHLPGMNAADSLLCFHAGIGRDDVKLWLCSCVERLEKIAQCCPEVNFYLSQMYAWAGLAKDSATAYRTYLHTGYKGGFYNSIAPGQPLSGKEVRQPWRVLLQMVQSPNSGTPKPLSVHWRTRLGTPRFCNVKGKDGSWEADMKSFDVNLTLSQDGKITGDLQLLLPPIRGVQLDPHTGILCFPYLPGETVPWKSFFEFRMDYRPGFEDYKGYGPTLVPTPVELYCDHHGNKVHLLRSSVMVTFFKSECDCKSEYDSNLLVWTGADGRMSKLNLDVLLRESVYKGVLKLAEAYHDFDEEMCEKSKKLLRKWCDTGKVMALDDLKTSFKRMSQGKSYPFRPVPFTCRLRSPARISSTIVIPMTFKRCQLPGSGGTCLVFVDCSCLETFSEPKLCHAHFSGFYYEDAACDDLGWDLVARTMAFPHTEIVPVATSSSEVVYYDKFGEEFDRVNLSEVNDECCRPQVYRKQVYYVNQNFRLTKSLNGITMTVDHFDFVDRMFVCRNVIIMTTMERLMFADSISFLPLEVLISDKISPSLPNGVDFKEKVKYFKVIGEKEITKDSGYKCNQVAIAMDTHLIVVEIPLCEEPDFIEMTLCVEVPGLAKDICFISPHVGVLVSVTQHANSEHFHRETLYHFDYSGRVQGLLPGLGRGPRSFLPLMLPIKTEGSESDRKAWHVYLRDGHDGILCILLH